MTDIKRFIETKFKKEIRAHTLIDKRDAELCGFPDDLNEDLKKVLIKSGIEKLYSHQTLAFQSVSANKDTLLVSSTASGKTFSFFLPILNEYTKSGSPFSVFFMYPTKALSRDQEGVFRNLIKAAGADAFLGTFDGDTPQEERNKLKKGADFVITNPDMLHNGILPNHNRGWKDFLSRLRYIVVDEVHIYRGAFGSHVANVFKRLLRACRIHGSSPVFVCSSATVGNPGEHVRSLFNREFTIIDKDGAPKSRKEIYYLNPPIVESDGMGIYRKSPQSISIPLIREALKLNIRTICFCRARQEVERLYRAVTDHHPELKDKIKPYRGGLLPNERRGLEKDLASGRIKAIITTNALELGIDIGDLDLCILSGHPGAVASFWQQAGRVGRKGKSSVIVYIAKDRPIDQYIVHHPEFIEKAPVEQAMLNADNPYILLQHLPCAACEYPLSDKEEMFDSAVYTEALELLKKDKTIVPYKENYRYALADYPSKGVNLRGMTDYNVEIYCGGEVIGELDPIGARGTLYKDAIYHHLGIKYMSMELDLEKKLCRVEEVDSDYFTEAVWEGRVELTEKYEEKKVHDALLEFGSIYVNKQPKLYKKIRERSYENIGYGPITLPPFEFDTTGFCLVPPESWIAALKEKDARFIGIALYGLKYLLKHCAPGLCMADINDISTDVSLVDSESKWVSSLYVFDSIEGGVGYSEKIYELFNEALILAKSIIEECECQSGCPSCVPPLPEGINNDDMDDVCVETDASIQCSKSLLTVLTENKIIIPEISVNKTITGIIPQYEKDAGREKMIEKLERANANLKKKRERRH